MRVACLVNKFPAVTQTFVLNQISGLLDRNQNVTIFARRRSRTETSHNVVLDYGLAERVVYSRQPSTYSEGTRTLVDTCLKLRSFEEVSIPNLLTNIRFGTQLPHRLANLRVILDSGEFDVYHAHFGYVGNAFLRVADYRDQPFVVSFYGVDASGHLRENPDRYDAVFDRADAITVLSEDMRSDLVEAGCPAPKTHIQPLCIDVEKFPYRARSRDGDEPIHVATVGRFVEKKGIEYALRAMAEVANTHRITYSIAGDGERRERIESLIIELGLEDSVNLLGWQSQSEIVDLMHDAHLFLLPSVTAEQGDKEGTPTVLLEAQATGLPVVSTRHAGIPEIVADGESGILVPERDVGALVDAIETLIRDPERREEMGARGRDRIEQKHAIDVVCDDLLDLYQSLQ